METQENSKSIMPPHVPADILTRNIVNSEQFQNMLKKLADKKYNINHVTKENLKDLEEALDAPSPEFHALQAYINAIDRFERQGSEREKEINQKTDGIFNRLAGLNFDHPRTNRSFPASGGGSMAPPLAAPGTTHQSKQRGHLSVEEAETMLLKTSLIKGRSFSSQTMFGMHPIFQVNRDCQESMEILFPNSQRPYEANEEMTTHSTYADKLEAHKLDVLVEFGVSYFIGLKGSYGKAQVKTEENSSTRVTCTAKHLYPRRYFQLIPLLKQGFLQVHPEFQLAIEQLVNSPTREGLLQLYDDYGHCVTKEATLGASVITTCSKTVSSHAEAEQAKGEFKVACSIGVPITETLALKLGGGRSKGDETNEGKGRKNEWSVSTAKVISLNHDALNLANLQKDPATALGEKGADPSAWAVIEFTEYMPLHDMLDYMKGPTKAEFLEKVPWALRKTEDSEYKGWINVDGRNGKGVRSWADGDVYDGEWKDDKMHGKGERRYANGEVYDGEWKDDERNGKGVLRWTNGDVYDGE